LETPEAPDKDDRGRAAVAADAALRAAEAFDPGEDTTGEPAPGRQAGRIARSTAFFSVATAASRIAGLGREIVAASYYGVSGPMSAFTIAFQVPNLVRALFADAALQPAFVPIFTEQLERKNYREAFRLACNQCHVLPDPQRHTAREWRAVVARMQENMEWMNRVVGSRPVPGEPQLRVEEIVRLYGIDEAQCLRLLLRLERIGILELHERNRIRLRLSRAFSWIPDGPMMRFVKAQADEFFAHRFDQPGELMRLVSVRVSREAQVALLKRIEQVVQEYAEQHAADARLPLAQRHPVTLLLGIRGWEPRAFKSLRRATRR